MKRKELETLDKKISGLSGMQCNFQISLGNVFNSMLTRKGIHLVRSNHMVLDVPMGEKYPVPNLYLNDYGKLMDFWEKVKM